MHVEGFDGPHPGVFSVGARAARAAGGGGNGDDDGDGRGSGGSFDDKDVVGREGVGENSEKRPEVGLELGINDARTEISNSGSLFRAEVIREAYNTPASYGVGGKR